MTELARRMFQLVEPIAVVTYMAAEPTDEVKGLGLPGVWDAYFAGRAAPLGRDVPAGVVDALFYNFAPGEVARHIPQVWELVTPGDASAARQRGSVAALRRILGDLADATGVARAANLLVKAGMSGSIEGRALYAAVLTLPIPTEPLACPWHGANLLREHRGDGHVAALVTAGIGEPRRTCSTPSPRACRRMSSVGSRTYLGPNWQPSLRGCGCEASSAAMGGSPIRAGRRRRRSRP